MNQQVPQSASRIVLPHPTVSVDMLLAVFLLRSFRHKETPVLAQAPVVYTPQPSDSDYTISRGEYKTYTESAANDLGVERLPEIQYFLKLAENAGDGGRGRNEATLASVVETLNRPHVGNPATVVEMLMPVLHQLLIHEKQFYYDGPNAWQTAQKEGRAQTYTVELSKGSLTIATLENADPHFAHYLQFNRKIGADISVIRSGDGHYHVATKPNSENVQLDQIVRVLRIQEARAKQRDLNTVKDGELGRIGATPNTPEWNYNDETSVILGIQSALTMDEVANAVYIGVGTQVWETNCPPTGCSGESCYFYAFGLNRCRDRQ